MVLCNERNRKRLWRKGRIRDMRLKMPAVFSDNMVLQRRKHVLIWGNAESGSCVTVWVAGQSADTIAENGEWCIKLAPMEAGGPYEMVVTAKDETLSFQNVLVGEVWLAGGQSNMELELQNSDNGKEVIKYTDDERIRFYYTPKIAYLGQELDEAEAHNCWMECKPEKTATWSAVGYYFAKQISKELDVPVGIIGCNWGGTIANNWVSRESLLKHGELAHFVKEYDELVAKLNYDEYLKELAEYKEYHAEWEKKTAELNERKPGVSWEEMLAYAGECRWPGPMGPLHEFRPAGLYECMVKRVAPFTLGGALYYQGESDENNHTIYRCLLQNLIEEWRCLWQDDELPFAIVQLPVFATEEKTGCGWGAIRKAQQDVYKTVKNTSLTTIIDCGEQHNIHPTDKETVGKRVAANVLKDIFGNAVLNGNGPCAIDYERDKVNDNSAIRVLFCGAEEGFYKNNEKLSEQEYDIDGFEIAGADGRYASAKVVISKNSILLYSEQIVKPEKVRYGNMNYYHAELKDSIGRPVMPFWFE